MNSSAFIQPTARRQFFGHLAAGAGALAALAAPPIASARTTDRGSGFDVRAFGAVGNGRRLDTASLQAAIEACAKAGGGTVRVPAGTYRTGTLVLRSRITLQLEAGATLLGSTELKDYPPRTPAFRSYTDVNYVERSLLYAEGLEQVSILGPGVIDGQGGDKTFQRQAYKRRPFLIRMVECRWVTLRDVRLRNSPMWVQHYLACDDLLLDGLTVESVVNGNNDGIDVDCCRRVRIANCHIRSGDDAIVLKSTASRACEQVAITNCVLSSDCNAFKCGTESTGGFRDIVVSNCVIHDTGLAGIALEMVDGGTLEGVMISNIRLVRTRGGIFLRLGNRARPYLASESGASSDMPQPGPGMTRPGVGQLRKVHIAQIQGDGCDAVGCALSGLPGHPLENIHLQGIRLEFAGDGTRADAQRPIPEVETAYPEYGMFGRLPAYGFYSRHVRGLTLDGVEVATVSADERPALVCDDVENLEVSAWRGTGSPDAPEIVLRNVRDAFLHGCRPGPAAASFVRVEGNASRDICVAATARPQGPPVLDRAPEVAPEAVHLSPP